MVKYDDDLKIFYSPLINDEFYFSGFSTKILGDGRKIDVISNFFQKSNFFFKKIVVLEQIHSANINFFISKTDSLFEKITNADGVITKDKETVLVIRSADCLSLIFVEKEEGIIGISHQGWRGTIKRMAQKMVDKMIEIGAKKQKIFVVFGPAIGICCYNIDEDRYFQFREEFSGYSDKIFSYRGGQIFLNLSLLNYLQLKDKGLEEKNIDFFQSCTQCDEKRFFSFRRQKKHDYGQMFNFIVRY